MAGGSDQQIKIQKSEAKSKTDINVGWVVVKYSAESQPWSSLGAHVGH